jgi:Gas vesicle synthesis protein GvpO
MAERRIVRTRDQDADERPAGRRARRSDDEGVEGRARTRRPRDDEDLDDRPRKPRTRKDESAMTAARAGQAALRQIAELTGKEPEGITGVEPTDDGWVVGVEVVEDRRIPSSTDILATYEAEFDEGGDLISYRRVKRYSRGRGDSGDS